MENPILTQLNYRYESFLKCLDTEKLDFKAYYNSIYEYIEVVENRPELQRIIEVDAQAVKCQIEKIEADKEIDARERKELIHRIQEFSFSDRYSYVRKKVYVPMHDYMCTGRKNLVGAILTNDWPYNGFGTSMFGAGVFYTLGSKEKAKMEIINFQYHDGIKLFKENVQRIHTSLTNAIIYLQKVSGPATPDKICIIVDEKKGIYQSGKEQNAYGIKKDSMRMMLIKNLISKDNCSVKELMEITEQTKNVTVKSVLEINELFRENLHLTDDLILHLKTGGYSLNKEVFDIVVNQ